MTIRVSNNYDHNRIAAVLKEIVVDLNANGASIQHAFAADDNTISSIIRQCATRLNNAVPNTVPKPKNVDPNTFSSVIKLMAVAINGGNHGA